MSSTAIDKIKSLFRKPLLFAYLTLRKLLGGYGLRRFAFIERGYALVSGILKDDHVQVNGYTMYYDVVNGIDCGGQTNGGQIYEIDLVNFYRKEIHEGDSIIDLGAESGYFTCLFAKLVGHSGCVFAFEANPKNFVYLKKNMEVNGFSQVTLVPKAVSDHEGQEKFFAHGPHSTLAYDRFHDAKDAMSVEMITLNSFFEANGGGVFLK